MESIQISNCSSEKHMLSDKWVLWAHLPHDTDWSLKSYINIITLENVEDTISIINTIPEKLVKNCMLFVMREGINPTWEDKRNCKGGCFSFKVNNKIVHSVWNDLLKSITGESISSNVDFIKDINGITISPKKSFCIIKIWMGSVDYQNPKLIMNIDGLSMHGCLFKKHKPEYK
jgi:translation initiation factor 4E